MRAESPSNNLPILNGLEKSFSTMDMYMRQLVCKLPSCKGGLLVLLFGLPASGV